MSAVLVNASSRRLRSCSTARIQNSSLFCIWSPNLASGGGEIMFDNLDSRIWLLQSLLPPFCNRCVRFQLNCWIVMGSTHHLCSLFCKLGNLRYLITGFGGGIIFHRSERNNKFFIYNPDQANGVRSYSQAWIQIILHFLSAVKTTSAS